MTATINITTKDIAKSQRYKGCPITYALQRRFGKRVSASRNFIRVSRKDFPKDGIKWHLVALPKKARNFMLDCKTQPFNFVLSPKQIKEVKRGLNE